MQMGLFSPIVSLEQLHPQFLQLANSPFHEPARAFMTSLFERMGDPNGTFLRDFQGHGFHPRLFELACFAYLEEAGLVIDRSYEQPDFICTRGGLTVAVEAVTSNPANVQAADISLQQMQPLSEPEIFEKVSREFPSRVGKSLHKKLRHNYHSLPQCAGKPLALTIAPFFEAGSVFYSDDALFHLLFGGPEGTHDVTYPFFQREGAEVISAILYCNQFTVSKFFRLTTNFLTRDAPRAIREGVCYLRHDGENHARTTFTHLLGTEGVPFENWAEGITVFENPFALNPLPRGLLPGSCYVSVEDGYVCREVSDFHPVVSFMRIDV